MIQRLLNIILVLVLLTSVVGVPTSKVYCTAMDKIIGKKCCDKKLKSEDCCKEVQQMYRLNTDLASVNASVNVPDILYFIVPFIATLYHPAIFQERLQHFSLYSSPYLIKDIGILVQVFRI